MAIVWTFISASYSMYSSFQALLKHLVVFLLIEIVFVLILFREFPETNLISLIGILHLSYWIVILAAGWLRERCTRIWQKFLCTYVPVLYHLAIHLYAGRVAIEMHEEAHHDEHSIVWMIVGA